MENLPTVKSPAVNKFFVSPEKWLWAPHVALWLPMQKYETLDYWLLLENLLVNIIENIGISQEYKDSLTGSGGQ